MDDEITQLKTAYENTVLRTIDLEDIIWIKNRVKFLLSNIEMYN